jgi:hypothetical protein
MKLGNDIVDTIVFFRPHSSMSDHQEWGGGTDKSA